MFYILIFVTCLFIIKNKEVILCYWKQACFYFIGLFLLGLAFWSKSYIGKTDIRAVFATLFLGTPEGLWQAPSIFLHSIFIFSVLVPLLLMTIIVLINSYMAKIQCSKFYQSFFSKIVGLTLILSGFCWLNYLYSLSYYIIETAWAFTPNQRDIFADNYKNPSDQEFIFAKKPKNLVLIYFESLDAHYQNEKIFKKNLLNSLLQFPHQSFSKFEQTINASYTIAGTVASQCGIPLNFMEVLQYGQSWNYFSNHFLPNATCLGDVLYQAGYVNVFMKGGSLDFAGTGAFFKGHHYGKIMGKEEWLKQGYTISNMGSWGLTDDLLFKEAKLELTQLMQQKMPFNLTLLTVDTHGPNGHLNKLCKSKGGEDFIDIVECTAQQLTGFIQFIKDKGWMDQIVIVVTGDHLSLVNPVMDQLTTNGPRYVFNMIIAPHPLHKQRDMIVHEDLFPTILNALDITWDDSHLGLGYSGFLPLPSDISSEEHLNVINTIDSKLKFSALYKQLWGIVRYNYQNNGTCASNGVTLPPPSLRPTRSYKSQEGRPELK